jgi:hypothetical protein
MDRRETAGSGRHVNQWWMRQKTRAAPCLFSGDRAQAAAAIRALIVARREQ